MLFYFLFNQDIKVPNQKRITIENGFKYFVKLYQVNIKVHQLYKF